MMEPADVILKEPEDVERDECNAWRCHSESEVILELNAAKPYGIDVGEVLERARNDAVQRRRADYRQSPDPHFLTFGPRTRREFLAAARGHKVSRPAFVLQARDRGDDGPARIGFTVTRRTAKKI